MLAAVAADWRKDARIRKRAEERSASQHYYDGKIYRVCRVCAWLKSLDTFAKDKRGEDGRDTICKACYNAHRRARYAAIANEDEEARS